MSISTEKTIEILPVKVSEPRRITEAFSEGIRIYFQFGDQLVLVGRDCGEHRLREDEGSVLFPRQIRDRATSFPHLHEMYPWLIPVHGV